MTDTAVNQEALNVIEGIELKGRVNVSSDTILHNVQYAIRQQHPQIKRQPPQADRVVLVGSGPSLAETEKELVALVHAGAKLVTVNGSYHWCLERNLKPSAQIMLDARPENARFLEPEVPNCHYILASQVHQDSWDMVAERPNVWVFHGACEDDAPERLALDAYYLKQWIPVAGGTTVATRALAVLRILGYLRFDLFGIDSCWMDGRHHAFSQPENDRDRNLFFVVSHVDDPTRVRRFECSPWHVKQAEDFLQFIRVNGDHFLLNVHGDGLIAYMLNTSADLQAHVESTQE